MKNFKLFCEAKDDRQLDWILDKINTLGEDSLSKAEKEYLNSLQGKTNDVVKSDVVKSNSHYNRYITKLLSDLKGGEITEEMANQFIEKYVSKEDLFSVLVQLLKDGTIDHLTNENL